MPIEAGWISTSETNHFRLPRHGDRAGAARPGLPGRPGAPACLAGAVGPGDEDVAFAVEGCTGWRYVAEELAAAGVTAHLAEPADTAFARGRKRHAKTDKTDCRTCGCCWPRDGCRSAGSRPAASWNAGRCSSCITTCGPRTAWVQRIHAVLFHQGAPALGEGTLRSAEQGLAARPAAAATQLSPAGQLQVATALDMTDALETRLHAVRHQLLDAARHLTGAKVLAARLYGVGPVTALAMTCWLAGEGRFSSSRKAVRFAGLDVTVSSSDRKGPPCPGGCPGKDRRCCAGPSTRPARPTPASSAPDHAYYAQVKDRCNGKRAALSEARKILRQACHILAELGDDALAAA